MESFNDIYDIESPRTSQRKMARVEHSIEQSLLYNNEATTHSYCGYSFFLMGLMFLLAFGAVACIILGILFGLKRLT